MGISNSPKRIPTGLGPTVLGFWVTTTLEGACLLFLLGSGWSPWLCLGVGPKYRQTGILIFEKRRRSVRFHGKASNKPVRFVKHTKLAILELYIQGLHKPTVPPGRLFPFQLVGFARAGFSLFYRRVRICSVTEAYEGNQLSL